MPDGPTRLAGDDANVAQTLARLRGHIAAIQSSVLASTRMAMPRAQIAPQDVPFDESHTAEGPLFSRGRDHGLLPRVGHFEAHCARAPDAGLLAMLAMDEQFAGVDFSRALYIDTETTGLSRGAGTVAFLIGCGYWHGLRFVTELLFVPDYGQERTALLRLAKLASEASSYVSFNGKAFDMPLLRTRYVMTGLPPLPDLPHMDLLSVARRVHKRGDGVRRGVRLQQLEREVLGLVREGDIPSSEVSAVYNHYVRSGDAEGLRAVADHNEQDVLSMVALLALYGEPLTETRLSASDLSGVARVMQKRGFGDEAALLADRAVATQANAHTLRARAEIAKARHQRDAALCDFERAHAEESDPRLRLELAKLYEHHRKDIARALEVAREGVAETVCQSAHRIARLTRKSRAS